MKTKYIYDIERYFWIYVITGIFITGVFGRMYWEMYTLSYSLPSNRDPGYLLIGVIMSAVLLVWTLGRSVVFIIRRNKCLEMGLTYDGEIIGKKTHRGSKGSRSYSLWVVYGDRVIETPKMSGTSSVRIASGFCTVHEYEGFTYVDGFDVAPRGSGTRIKDLDEIREMKHGDI